MNQKIENMELRIAHQEDGLQKMSREMFEQQKQIERLEILCEALVGRVRTLSDAGEVPSEADEKPPHY
jgi:SlyX protein